jgi:hypothetical protein
MTGRMGVEYTVRDIAKATGLSKSKVDRIINK